MSLTPPDNDIDGDAPTSAPTPTDALSASPTEQPSATSTPRGFDPEDPPNKGILNYYFLLLALCIILLAIVYIAIIKRRRQRLALVRMSGQRALARDLEHSTGTGPWAPGRFRTPRFTAPRHRPQTEEGLDERGEAPPPYVPKEPEPAYTGAHRDRAPAGSDIPLRDLGGFDQKPPDYNEGPSSAGGGRGTGPV
ncbi:MAG: hypothetical protein LQ348_006115 [Seirophora lacunosa]|nr:MAG: hypothetical protein LQ344_005418 [Seirophora lacunosa]KAI4175714.1 MAG: hypothetical protein LQ348_006115 [Seirophora lacunosa]